MAKTFNAIVIQRIEVNPQLIKLRVMPDGWELPDFTPGQFTLLGVPWTTPRHHQADPDSRQPRNPDRFILRSYSVASSSVAKEFLEFYIGMDKGGTLSPRLLTLGIGDRLYVGPEFNGMFTLSEVPKEFNVALIATGTGVAPYMSMLRSEIIEGFRHRFAVIHGAYHSSDLGYHDELKALDAASPIFSYIPIISRPEDEPVHWEGPVGRVQKLWTARVLDKVWGFHPNPENTHVFLSGNPAMIDDMLEILAKEGFQEHTERQSGQVHTERFTSV